MKRHASALLIPLTVLTACGGGGGKGGALPPETSIPQAKKTGTATFSLEIPGKNTLSRVRRPYYQSQATQGVAIDWSSSDPTHPDYSAAISATCPALPSLPAGVTGCSIDGQGNTDYTFELEIPAGSYSDFTVTTFDTAPTLGDFTGNMLAQGQIAAPVVIVAGTANTIPALTFYGVPATVSFVPGPSQSHVLTYNGNLSVIGNAPQTFYAQAEDADGFLISSSDTGAPSITVTESSSDSPQHFTIASLGGGEYTLTAVDASANATIDAVATPGGTGLSAVTNAVTVTPLQEMWTTQAGGTGTMGILGYPLYPPAYVPTFALDSSNPQLCSGSCNWYYAATDPHGDIWAIAQDYGVYEFTQGSGSQGVIAPSAATAIPLGTSPQSMAIDHNGYIYLVDSYNSTIKIYNTASPSSTPLTTITDSNGVPASIAIAPGGDIYVGDSVGITVYNAYGGGSTAPSQAGQITNNVGYAEGLSFDPNGRLWIFDSGNGAVEVTTAGTSSISIAASATPGTYDGAEQIGVTAQGVGWMGGPGSLNGIFSYTFSGSTLTASSNYSTFGSLGVPSVWSVMITP